MGFFASPPMSPIPWHCFGPCANRCDMLAGPSFRGKGTPRMSHLRFFGSAVLTTLTIAIPSISTGQTAPSPEWSVITTTQIKPEFRQEYEAVQKEVSAAYKKAGIPYRYVVQTILGDVEEDVSIAPISKLADMDAA